MFAQISIDNNERSTKWQQWNESLVNVIHSFTVKLYELKFTKTFLLYIVRIYECFQKPHYIDGSRLNESVTESHTASDT